MKSKVYEAEGTTIDAAIYAAMEMRWRDDNHKDAEVVDTRIISFMGTGTDGYRAYMGYRVWLRDA